MAENPDRKDPTHGVSDFVPEPGDLRFVERESFDFPTAEHGRTLRILQRWEWSYVDAKWSWYDVGLVEE